MDIETAIETAAAEKREALQELHLFDGNMWLGAPKGYPLAEELRAPNVGAVLETYNLEGGLVSSWDGVTLSAQDGNASLQASAQHLPKQVGIIWNGLPLLPREQDPLPGFEKPFPRTGGVRLFPKSHRYLLRPWVVGTFCDWCVQYRVPLFLWHIEIEWDWVYELAGAFPKLNIIIESQWQKILYHTRNLYNLMESRDNVFHEISNFAGQDLLYHGVKTFGAHRFIFGSFLPVNDPLVPAGMILDADLSAEEKTMIAGGSLRRLIGEVKV